MKRICLKGYPRNALGLLNQLELPDGMDEVRFFLDDWSKSDLSQTLGRYLGVLVRLRKRFQELRVHPGEARFHVFAGDVTELCGSFRVNWFVVMGASVRDGMPQGEEVGWLCSAVIEQLPIDEIVYLRTTAAVLALEGPCAGMSDLATFHIDGLSVPTWFADPPLGEFRAHEEPFPSLKYLSVSPLVLDLGAENWDQFIAFLSRRASVGRRIVSLMIGSWPDAAQEERIRNVVGDFTLEIQTRKHPDVGFLFAAGVVQGRVSSV